MHKAVYPVFAFHLGSTQAPCKSSVLAVAREHKTQNSNTDLRTVATNLDSRAVQRNKKRARAKHATPHAKADSNQSRVAAPQSCIIDHIVYHDVFYLSYFVLLFYTVAYYVT